MKKENIIQKFLILRFRKKILIYAFQAISSLFYRIWFNVSLELCSKTKSEPSKYEKMSVVEVSVATKLLVSLFSSPNTKKSNHVNFLWWMTNVWKRNMLVSKVWWLQMFWLHIYIFLFLLRTRVLDVKYLGAK